MNYRLKASLLSAIDKWMEKESSSNEWADVGYVGENMTLLMTEAASAVLDCCTDLNKYHEKEGNYK